MQQKIYIPTWFLNIVQAGGGLCVLASYAIHQSACQSCLAMLAPTSHKQMMLQTSTSQRVAAILEAQRAIYGGRRVTREGLLPRFKFASLRAASFPREPRLAHSRTRSKLLLSPPNHRKHACRTIVSNIQIIS